MGFFGVDEAIAYIDQAVRIGSLQERAIGCELLGRLGRTDRIPLLKEALPALLEAARGQHSGDALPPGLRGATADPAERLIMLACVRILRGEKEDLVITTLPGQHDLAYRAFQKSSFFIAE